MQTAEFIKLLLQSPEQIEFNQTIDVIDSNYIYTPTAFKNGEVFNDAGENEGSCKIFAFSQLNNLDKGQTLACFGKFYREDVLGNPKGANHQNIRSFLVTGWYGIEFETNALVPI